MDFEGLLRNPYVSIVVSVATGVIGNLVWSNINKKKIHVIIKKSLTSTVNCIESYREHSEIVTDVLKSFEKIIFGNVEGGKLKDSLLVEFRLILKNYDLLNLQYQDEFIRLFFLFFLTEIEKDDELWNHMEFSFINSIYQEVLETKQFIGVEAKNFQVCFKETQNILQIYLTGILDCSSYKNKINGMIKELHLIKNDESILFGDIFSFLKIKILNSWKERCQEVIKKICYSETNGVNKSKLRELEQYFEDSTSCEIINDKLKNIESYLKTSDCDEIAEMRKLNYDKCFIVSGEPGTGKTEFIKEMMMHYLKTDEIYLVPLDQESLNRCGNMIDVEKTLIENINFYLGTSLDKLSDLITYCKNIEKIRIVILIDNLHIISLTKKRTVDLIIRTMKNNSGINILFWIFTVDQYNMHIFDEVDIVDFQRYVIFGRNFNYGACSSIYNYDFNLTKYNQYIKTGEKILTSYGCKNVDILMNNSNIITLKTVDNPLFAHFIGMKKGDIGSLQLESFYIDFAESVIKYLQSSLNDVFDKDTEINENIKQGTISIGKYVIDHSAIEFSQRELLKIIDKNTERALKQVDLIIRIGTKTNEVFLTENFGEEEEILQLHFKLFWAYKIFMASDIISRVIFSEEFYNIFSNLMRIEKYREEICEYVTYYLEQQENIEHWRQWLSILNNEQMLYVLFVYLDRLAPKSISQIFSILNILKMKLSHKDIYTLVYALSNVTASIEDKYKLIALYAGEIENATKQYINFTNVFNAITGQNTSCGELLKNILYLIDNEAVKLNIIMGSSCAEKFCQLSDSNFLESIKIIKKFVEKNEEKLKKAYNKEKNKEKVGKRYFFDEFIKQYFYIQISVNRLAEVYNEMNKNGFFKGTKGWRCKLFRYNFSRAAGDAFSQYQMCFNTIKEQTFRSDYIELVRQLIRTRNSPEIIFGFHFITNSLKNDRDNSEDLDPALQDLLLEIYNMDGIDVFKKKRKKFFERVSK